MNPASLRVVLAFYSGEEEGPEAAYREVRNVSRGRAFRFGPKSEARTGARAIDRYSALRLEGETLVAAEASTENVEAIVRQLQDVGSPAVFVLREDLANLVEPALDATLEAGVKGSARDFARQCAQRGITPDKSRKDESLETVFAELEENEIALDAARRDLVEAARLGHALTAAAEWLLDNAYLIRTQIAEIRRHLPRRYSTVLPT